jgi:hypothetical protein
MIDSKHTLSYCLLCESDMVVCGTCGNNSCNGSYGPGPNGDVTKCPDCPEAYDHQAAYRRDENSVKFAKDERVTASEKKLPEWFVLARERSN